MEGISQNCNTFQFKRHVITWVSTKKSDSGIQGSITKFYQNQTCCHFEIAGTLAPKTMPAYGISSLETHVKPPTPNTPMKAKQLATLQPHTSSEAATQALEQVPRQSEIVPTQSSQPWLEPLTTLSASNTVLSH